MLVLRVCLACTAVALVLGLASGCQSTDDALSGAPDAGDSVPDASAPSTSDASTRDVPRKSLRVLFIGNSYTYVNDVPGILTRIATTATTGPTIAIDQVLRGGATLQDHWDDGIAQSRIAEGHWTHVIVQGQSLEPTSSDNTSFMSNAKKFGELATSAGARATWFVTWARAKEEFNPTVAETSATRMQDELTFAYAESMRQVPGSLLACVGEAFRKTLHDHPEIVLHQDDHSHAGMAGSYLAAATIYVALTGSPVPPASTVPEGINANVAAILRDAARVGSSCADVRVRADVSLYGEPWWLDDEGISTTGDFGTSGAPLTHYLYFRNFAAGVATITDAMTLAPPFGWSNGAYPGGVGVDPIRGEAYCSSTLAPRTSCAVSLSYSGASTSNGTMTLKLTGAYQPQIMQALKGTTTDRGHLAIHRAEPMLVVYSRVGETKEFPLLVSNVGVKPASSIAQDLAPSAPFSWGGSGVFPGGAGPTERAGATYEHCATAVAPGDTCVISLRVTPLTTGGQSSMLGLESWSGPSPAEPATRDVVRTSLFSWALPALPAP